MPQRNFSTSLSDPLLSQDDEDAIKLEEFATFMQTFLLAMLTFCTIVGNAFIILTVLCHPNLRRPSHLFIASLASTDLLLGIAVMVPRLVSELVGRWIFGFVLCQAYHAMDVTLCTSSILHLCCVSLDRYFAIVNQPLLYYSRITPAKVALMVAVTWTLSLLTGFVPVFTGIYSSEEHLELSRQNTNSCDLVVNKYFSVLAGLVSFWLPGSVMVYVYFKVYRETKRLQKDEARISLTGLLAGRDKSKNPGSEAIMLTKRGTQSCKDRVSVRRCRLFNDHNCPRRQQQQQPVTTITVTPTKSDGGDGCWGSSASCAGGRSEHTLEISDSLLDKGSGHHSLEAFPPHQQLLPSAFSLAPLTSGRGPALTLAGSRSYGDLGPIASASRDRDCYLATTVIGQEVGESRLSGRQRCQSVVVPHPNCDREQHQQSLNRERESRAARTVGIVIGIFLVCWLPFFIWMPLTSLLELHTPPLLYSIILWFGYCNSVVNPFVYGFFSREFRSVIIKDISKFRNKSMLQSGLTRR